MSKNFTAEFLNETIEVIRAINPSEVDAIATTLANVRTRGGRLFILGVGGSAGHASHAVNDFRKICAIESYCPTDNVSELTARINDEGWDTCFSEWLKGCRINAKDGLLIFSVGGGNRDLKISVNLTNAIDVAKEAGASVTGIVGKDGGYTKKMADACVVLSPLFKERITPHTEGLAAVVWHLLVSHPLLQKNQTKWESAVR